jgi:hypothetical protein
LSTIVEGFGKNSPTWQHLIPPLREGFHEKKVDGILLSIIPLLFRHGRPLEIARVVVLKGN